MLAMGLSLETTDFKRILIAPKPVILGLLGQMLLLPCCALLIIKIVHMSPEVAVGLLLLAASPGGVTSNAISFAARADIALSVSLTAISSVFVAFTLPLWAAYGMSMILDSETDFSLSVASSIVQLASLTIAPVIAGMVLRHYFRSVAIDCTDFLRKFCFLLICFMAITTTFYNVEHFVSVSDVLRILLICSTLMLLTMLVAAGISRLCGLSVSESMTLVIEVGVQNIAITLFAAMSLLQRPEIARLPLIYGILMISLPWLFIYYFKHKK